MTFKSVLSLRRFGSTAFPLVDTAIKEVSRQSATLAIVKGSAVAAGNGSHEARGSQPGVGENVSHSHEKRGAHPSFLSARRTTPLLKSPSKRGSTRTVMEIRYDRESQELRSSFSRTLSSGSKGLNPQRNSLSKGDAAHRKITKGLNICNKRKGTGRNKFIAKQKQQKIKNKRAKKTGKSADHGPRKDKSGRHKNANYACNAAATTTSSNNHHSSNSIKKGATIENTPRRRLLEKTQHRGRIGASTMRNSTSGAMCHRRSSPEEKAMLFLMLSHCGVMRGAVQGEKKTIEMANPSKDNLLKGTSGALSSAPRTFPLSITPELEAKRKMMSFLIKDARSKAGYSFPRDSDQKKKATHYRKLLMNAFPTGSTPSSRASQVKRNFARTNGSTCNTIDAEVNPVESNYSMFLASFLPSNLPRLTLWSNPLLSTAVQRAVRSSEARRLVEGQLLTSAQSADHAIEQPIIRKNVSPAALAAVDTFHHRDGPIVFSYAMLVDLLSVISLLPRSFTEWRAVMYALKSPVVLRLLESKRFDGRGENAANSSESDNEKGHEVAEHNSHHSDKKIEVLDELMYSLWAHFNGVGEPIPLSLSMQRQIEIEEADRAALMASEAALLSGGEGEERGRITGEGSPAQGEEESLPLPVIGAKGKRKKLHSRRQKDAKRRPLDKGPNNDITTRPSTFRSEHSVRRNWESFFPIGPQASEPMGARKVGSASENGYRHLFLPSSASHVHKTDYGVEDRRGDYSSSSPSSSFLPTGAAVVSHSSSSKSYGETSAKSFNGPLSDPASLSLATRYSLRSLMWWAKAGSPVRFASFIKSHGLERVLGDEDITITDTHYLREDYLTNGVARETVMEWLGSANQRALVIQSPYGTGKTTLLKEIFSTPAKPVRSHGMAWELGEPADSSPTERKSTETVLNEMSTAATMVVAAPPKRILMVSYRVTLAMNWAGNFPDFEVYSDLNEKTKKERSAARSAKVNIASGRFSDHRGSFTNDSFSSPNMFLSAPTVSALPNEAFVLSSSRLLDFAGRSREEPSDDARAEMKDVGGLGLESSSNGVLRTSDIRPPPDYIREAPRLICQVDSLHYIRGIRYDMVVLDEIEGILNHFSGETLKEKRGEIFTILSELIFNADRVIAMDGDIGNRTKAFLLQLLPLRQIRYIVNEKIPRKLNFMFCSGKAYFENAMEAALMSNKNIAIITMSLQYALRYEKEFRNRYSTVCYTSETPDSDRLCLKNVNEEWVKHRVIIFSPSIEAGVDFNIPHIDNIFVIMHSSTDLRFCSTSQRGLTQMLARIRQFRDPNILCWRRSLPVLGNTETRYTSAEVRLLYRDIVSRSSDLYEPDNLVQIMHYNKAEELNKLAPIFIPIFLQMIRDKGHTFEVIDDSDFSRRFEREQRAKRREAALEREIAMEKALIAQNGQKDRESCQKTTSEKALSIGAISSPNDANLAQTLVQSLSSLTVQQQEFLLCDVRFLRNRGVWFVQHLMELNRKRLCARRLEELEMERKRVDQMMKESAESAVVDSCATLNNRSPVPKGEEMVERTIVPTTSELLARIQKVSNQTEHAEEITDGSDIKPSLDECTDEKITSSLSPSDRIPVSSGSPRPFLPPVTAALKNRVAISEQRIEALSAMSLEELIETPEALAVTDLHLCKICHQRVFRLSFNTPSAVRKYFGRIDDFYLSRQLFCGPTSNDRETIPWAEEVQREAIVKTFLGCVHRDWRRLLLQGQVLSAEVKNVIDWRKWADVLHAERASLGLPNRKISSEEALLAALSRLLREYFITLRFEKSHFANEDGVCDYKPTPYANPTYTDNEGASHRFLSISLDRQIAPLFRDEDVRAMPRLRRRMYTR